MLGNGEAQKEAIRPDFNRSIFIDFAGAKITSDVENRIKEGKNTLRWDKTSCHRFPANEAMLKMGFLAYNLLHLIRRFYLWGEDTRRSIEWIITRLVKAGARIVYHARRWHVHVA